MRRCSIVNWLSYFQFDVPSVALPENEKLNVIEVRVFSEDVTLGVTFAGCCVMATTCMSVDGRGAFLPYWPRQEQQLKTMG